MSNLCLAIKGTRWVSYPQRLVFPKLFFKVYPFRGRGFVSRLLFLLNRLHLDRLLLRKEISPLPIEDVAWFWPSPKRSIKRFYGYRVKDGDLVGYIKVACGSEEKNRLAREVKNVRLVSSASPKKFKIPKCIGTKIIDGCLVAEFEPLPKDARNITDRPSVLEKVCEARKEIASFGFAHGDYLPHNIKIAGDDLWVIDWEEMTSEASCVLDEISFETAFRYFVRHEPLWKIAAWVEQNCQTGSEGLRDGVLVALHSMSNRNVGLGGEILKLLKLERK